MIARVGLQARGRDGARIETGDEVSALAGEDLAVGRAHFAIDAEDDSTGRKVQTLADILGVVQVEPEPAGFVVEPLFSVT